MAFAVTEFVSSNFESIVDKNADGTVWECTFDIVNPQCDHIELFLKYTKDASSNFTLKNEFVHEDVSGEFFGETILNLSASTIDDATLTHSEEGGWRVIVPVTKSCDKVRFVITPDVATGSDTLEIFADEIVVKPTR